jgi:plasmid maintenance system antidote protein VapI
MDRRQQLQDWMRDNGYSIASLGRALGYGSYPQIHSIVTGSRKLSDAFIGRFYRCFGPEATTRVFGTLGNCLGQDKTQ